MIKAWTSDAWADYVWWQSQDKKTLKRINQLIKEIERDPRDGLGKPEPLTGDLSGLFSRRIDTKNRLIYETTGTTVTIYSCRDHYSDH
ncbi:MAG: Txe/YoeB family addiction module toxin [Parolsenella sp.]|uniref:Txe/YoeB family addiction module toxin n=1 Tax=Parolsenella sp. TaxID=2083006 RepID=UPI002A766A62|nr:Txe/YoeB family addiction module toxin [Parolsenella sp.]MCI5950404.1 Txe/YoeB family addiction module toxin [Coriobacteriaceae bacterium]MDY3292092.1 Txe/YoeB family addiction module toxin [Parolsenella sp.]